MSVLNKTIYACDLCEKGSVNYIAYFWYKLENLLEAIGVDNDVSGRQAGFQMLSSTSCDLDLWRHDPQSRQFHALALWIMCVWESVRSFSKYRVTTCLENLEISVNLTAVGEMLGIVLNVRKTILSGKSCLNCLLQVAKLRPYTYLVLSAANR